MADFANLLSTYVILLIVQKIHKYYYQIKYGRIDINYCQIGLTWEGDCYRGTVPKLLH